MSMLILKQIYPTSKCDEKYDYIQIHVLMK